MNLSSFLFPANKKGLTIVELLICFVLIAFVGFLTFSTINKSYKSLQKSAINVGMSESQSLALQKLSKSGVLKQILSTQISNAEFNNYRSCVLGTGSNCKAQFDGRIIPLNLAANDPLAKEFNGAFGRDIASCSDPLQCDTSFTRSTNFLISCESDSQCSQAKISLNTNAVKNTSDLGVIQNRNLELIVSKNDLFSSNLSGTCSASEGYVNEIDVSNNTLKCQNVNESLPQAATASNCGLPSMSGTDVFAGIKSTSFDPSNECQKVTIANWSSVSGYPSTSNNKPSIKIDLAVQEPNQSNIALEGDLYLIMDNSNSIKPIRDKIASALKDLVNQDSAKDLRVRVYNTDTFYTSIKSNPPTTILPYAGLLQSEFIETIGNKTIKKTELLLNTPAIDFDTKNQTNNGEFLESELSKIPTLSGEVMESGVCTLLRLAEQKSLTPNAFDSQRKSIFLIVTDENDAFEDPTSFPLSPSMKCRRSSEVESKTVFNIYKRFNSYKAITPSIAYSDTAGNLNAKTTFSPKEIIAKGLNIVLPFVSISYSYKFKIADDIQTQYGGFMMLIKPEEFGITDNVCNDELYTAAKKYLYSSAIQSRFNNGNKYYSHYASNEEANTIDWASCSISAYDPGPSVVVLKSFFSNPDDFYSYDFATNASVQLATKSSLFNYDRLNDVITLTPYKHYSQFFSSLRGMPSFGVTKNMLLNSSYAVDFPQYTDTGLNSNFYKLAAITYYEAGSSYKYSHTSDTNVDTSTGEYISYPYEQIISNIETGTYRKTYEELTGIKGDPTETVSIIADHTKKYLDRQFGNSYAINAIVNTSTSNNSCTGGYSTESQLYKNLVELLPSTRGIRNNICDYNNYATNFQKIQNFFTTYLDVSTYDYNYEITDEAQALELKNYLSTIGVENLELEVTLKLPSIPNSISTVVLQKNVDFTFDVDLNASPLIFKIKFEKNDKIKNYLLNYKGIEINI